MPFPLSTPEHRSPELSVKPKDAYGVLARFLFLTYFFSQGNPEVQNYLFTSAKPRYRQLLPEFSSDNTAYATDQVVDKALPNFQRFLSPKTHAMRGAFDSSATPHDLRHEATVMINSLYGRFSSSMSAQYFARRILTLDQRYIVLMGGRERQEGAPGMYGDAFLSHALHFGVLNYPIGDPALAAVYKTVGPELLADMRAGAQIWCAETDNQPSGFYPIRQVFDRVAEVYVAHHPQAADGVAQFAAASLTPAPTP